VNTLNDRLNCLEALQAIGFGVLFLENDFFRQYETYKTKNGRTMVEPAAKKLKPISVTFLTNQRKSISVS
jgi:hypothetical protein